MNKGSKYYNYNTKKPLKIGHAQNTSKSYYLKKLLIKKQHYLKNGNSKIRRFKTYLLKSAYLKLYFYLKQCLMMRVYRHLLSRAINS